MKFNIQTKKLFGFFALLLIISGIPLASARGTVSIRSFSMTNNVELGNNASAQFYIVSRALALEGTIQRKDGSSWVTAKTFSPVKGTNNLYGIPVGDDVQVKEFRVKIKAILDWFGNYVYCYSSIDTTNVNPPVIDFEGRDWSKEIRDDAIDNPAHYYLDYDNTGVWEVSSNELTIHPNVQVEPEYRVGVSIPFTATSSTFETAFEIKFNGPNTFGVAIYENEGEYDFGDRIGVVERTSVGTDWNPQWTPLQPEWTEWFSYCDDFGVTNGNDYYLFFYITIYYWNIDFMIKNYGDNLLNYNFEMDIPSNIDLFEKGSIGVEPYTLSVTNNGPTGYFSYEVRLISLRNDHTWESFYDNQRELNVQYYDYEPVIETGFNLFISGFSTDIVVGVVFPYFDCASGKYALNTGFYSFEIVIDNYEKVRPLYGGSNEIEPFFEVINSNNVIFNVALYDEEMGDYLTSIYGYEYMNVWIDSAFTHKVFADENGLVEYTGGFEQYKDINVMSIAYEWSSLPYANKFEAAGYKPTKGGINEDVKDILGLRTNWNDLEYFLEDCEGDGSANDYLLTTSGSISSDYITNRNNHGFDILTGVIHRFYDGGVYGFVDGPVIGYEYVDNHGFYRSGDYDGNIAISTFTTSYSLRDNSKIQATYLHEFCHFFVGPWHAPDEGYLMNGIQESSFWSSAFGYPFVIHSETHQKLGNILNYFETT
jgi:hypothetical protein